MRELEEYPCRVNGQIRAIEGKYNQIRLNVGKYRKIKLNVGKIQINKAKSGPKWFIGANKSR